MDVLIWTADDESFEAVERLASIRKEIKACISALIGFVAEVQDLIYERKYLSV
jgi:hypothetical protein